MAAGSREAKLTERRRRTAKFNQNNKRAPKRNVKRLATVNFGGPKMPEQSNDYRIIVFGAGSVGKFGLCDVRLPGGSGGHGDGDHHHHHDGHGAQLD